MTSRRWWHRAPRTGDLLVATPELDDPSFRRTVVYLIEHNDEGSVGVVLNRPSRTPVGAVLSQWHDLMSEPSVVHEGGPVQPDGALCLAHLHPLAQAKAHYDEHGPIGIRPLAGGSGAAGIGVVDLDSEADLVGRQVQAVRVFAGHAGWGEEQLHAEVELGAWYVLRADPQDVFSADPGSLWRRVLRRQPSPLNWVSTYPNDPEDN